MLSIRRQRGTRDTSIQDALSDSETLPSERRAKPYPSAKAANTPKKPRRRESASGSGPLNDPTPASPRLFARLLASPTVRAKDSRNKHVENSQLQQRPSRFGIAPIIGRSTSAVLPSIDTVSRQREYPTNAIEGPWQPAYLKRHTPTSESGDVLPSPLALARTSYFEDQSPPSFPTPPTPPPVPAPPLTVMRRGRLVNTPRRLLIEYHARDAGAERGHEDRQSTNKNLKNADSVESQTSPLTPTPDRPTTRKPTRIHDNMAEFKKWRNAQDSQFSIKNGKKHHPYPSKEVPFPRNYDRVVLDHEMWEALFFEQMLGGICFHEFSVPPARVLDLGCGTGHWIISAARKWKDTHFVGVDIAPIQPDLERVGLKDLASRITWVNASFLEKLPLPDNHFDFAVVKRIGRAVPEDKSHFVFEELHRVLKPGGSLELLDEDLYFPGSKSEGGDNTTATSTPAPSVHQYSGDSKQLSDYPPSSSFNSESSDFTPESLVPSTDDDQEKRSENTCSEPSSSYYGRDNSFETARVYQPSDISSNFSSEENPRSYLDTIKSKKRYSLGYREPVRHFQTVTGRVRSYSCTREDVSRLEEDRLKYDETPTPTNMFLKAKDTSEQSDSLTPSPGSGVTHSTDYVMVGAPSESALSETENNGDYDQYSRKHKRNTSTGLNGLDLGLLHLDHQDAPGGPIHRRESDASLLLDPSPTQPLNPRDHSLLTRIYEEMHADRFINLSPLSLIGAFLNIYFTHVTSHAPVSFTFPPKPRSETVEESAAEPEVVDDPLPLLKDDDLDWLVHSSFVTGTKIKQTANPNSSSSTSLPNSQHHSSTGRSSISSSAHDSASSHYIVIDSARLPAVPVFRPTPRTNTLSPLSTSGPSFNEIATSPIETPHADNSLHIQLPHPTTDSLEVPLNPTPDISSSSSIPPSPADTQPPDPQIQENVTNTVSKRSFRRVRSPGVRVNIRPKVMDMKSLHMHLSIRVAETLACAESMWEWVAAEQTRHAKDMRGGLTRRGDHQRDRQLEVIWEMTRDEFDQCLSRFEMDMQDKMYLDHALEQYLGMKNYFTSKSAERRSFDAAAAAWDALQAQLQSSSQNQSQSTTTNNSSISHPRPHRRPQNRQVSAASTATTATYSNNNSSSNLGGSHEESDIGANSSVGNAGEGTSGSNVSDILGSSPEEIGKAQSADRRSMMSSSTSQTEGVSGRRLLSRTIRIYFATKAL